MTGRWIRAATGLAAALVLAACLPVGGGATKPAGPNPVTGSEIEVTALDPGPSKPTEKRAEKPAEEPAAKPAQEPEAAPKSAPAAPAMKPKPRPEGAAEGDPEAAPNDAPDAEPADLADQPAKAPPTAPAVAEAEKTKAQIACEKKKGVWAVAGNGLRACVTYTKDSGKSCRKGGDCEGDCLARSGTCAPFTPLFGCNEVFDEGGRRVTLCLD